MERRNSLRYRLPATVVFSWENAQGRRFQGEGETRDLSVAGAYVYSSTCPPISARVLIEVLLPSPRRATKGVAIRVEGGVVRVEHGSDGTISSGFAMAIRVADRERFRLVRLERWSD